MSDDAADRARAMVDAVSRTESHRVLSTLIRLLGDFDLAGEALPDAFRAALQQRPRDGASDNPFASLSSCHARLGSLSRRKDFPLPLRHRPESPLPNCSECAIKK